MPRSNYTKIFDMLTELAKEEAPKDLFQFAEEIHAREIESFAVFRPDPEDVDASIRMYCSPEAIRRLIRFTADVGFIEIDEERRCSLTTYGRNALRPDNYNSTLATHLAIYLKDVAGVTFTEIKDTISSIRRPEVAFFETVFRRIKDARDLKIGEDRFRMVLYLLERCGMLTTITRKIYFAQEPQAW